MLRIELHKPSEPQTPLGLGLVEEERDGVKGIFVKKIQAQSLVDVDGQIQIGDQILEVKLSSWFVAQDND